MIHGKTIANPNGRIIVIGDLQGCHQEAIQLLDKCKITAKDVVIMAGDLIDRGPDNDKCVDLAMELEDNQRKPAAIMGNHEERHLQYRELELTGEDPNVRVESHVRTRKQLRDEHYEYMTKMPHYIKLPEHNAVVVHAGLYPGLPIERQEARHLMHIQMINTRDTRTVWPSKVPNDGQDWRFWTNLYDGPERVIFGHSVFDKPLLTDKLAGIDGGACFGLQLHALILPDWRIVSVSGLADHGSRSRGREGRTIQMYNVHGDVNTFS